MSLITVCPRCGGINVKPAPGEVVGIMPSNRYICEGCKFEGIFPAVDEEGLIDFQQKLYEQKENE